MELIFMSCHSCALLLLGRAAVMSGLLEPIWLVCRKLSVRLFPSSPTVLGAAEGNSDEPASDAPIRRNRSCRSCWSCSEICSTGRAATISSRTVGRRARTV
jgi:hypothetical protein